MMCMNHPLLSSSVESRKTFGFCIEAIGLSFILHPSLSVAAARNARNMLNRVMTMEIEGRRKPSWVHIVGFRVGGRGACSA
jgi:hypothetical protein